MDQPIHEHREPPLPVPEHERDAPISRWSLERWFTVVCGVLVVGIVATLLPLYLMKPSVEMQSEVRRYLNEMSAVLFDAVRSGATLDEARALALAEGFDGTVADGVVRINPDHALWADAQAEHADEDAPTMLVVDRLFDDCFLLPQGKGKAGYYGCTAMGRPRFIPEGELPDWARP